MATHKDETFEDATVDLDGETFENCTFRNVTLAYSGGEPPVLDGCKFEEFTFDFRGAASNTALFMRALSEAPGGDDIIRQNFPALFKNH